MGLKNLKEKFVGAAGSISGAASILGSWQVCHSACLGIIAILSLVGITLTGMPLLFLTKIAVPLWIIAVLLLGLTAFLYFKKNCVSRNLILFNSGLLIAGIPFASLQPLQIGFWSIGGVFALLGISLYVKEKISEKISSQRDCSGKNCQKQTPPHHKPARHKRTMFLFALLVLFVAAGCTSFVPTIASSTVARDSVPGNTLVEQTPQSFGTKSTGSTGQGDVLIEITPQGVVDGQFAFAISANTHSVDLAPFDLEEITTLNVDGSSIKPAMAPKLSGHHASGTLLFTADGADGVPDEYTITITGIPTIEERVFSWGSAAAIGGTP